jgi:hypothetical protein
VTEHTSWLVSNLGAGIIITLIGVAMIFVGSYFGRKTGILHIVIYFMASFVIFGGMPIIFLHDRAPIFQ